MASMEENFPRGGIQKKPTETTGKKAKPKFEQDNLFDIHHEEQTQKRKRSEGDHRKQKKFKADIKPRAKDVAINVEPLTIQELCEGMLLLGCIKEVTVFELVISLPNGLTGFVPVTQISDAYSELLSKQVTQGELLEDLNSLSDLYSPGMLVRCAVTSVEKSADGRRSIKLSINPKNVNKGLNASALTPGMLLSGFVSSVEDHGYLIDIGVRGTHAFLPRQKAQNYIKAVKRGSDLKIGQNLNCLIEEVKNEGRVARLSADRSEVAASIATEQQNWTLSNLLPGLVVKAQVQKVAPLGIGLTFLSSFTGIVDFMHVDPEKSSNYYPNQVVKACILSTHPTSKVVHLTLRQSFLHPGGSPNQLSNDRIGAVVGESTVKAFYKQFGAVFELDDGMLAFARLKHLSKTRKSFKPAAFKAGCKHKCRIIDYSLMDEMCIVSLKHAGYGFSFRGAMTGDCHQEWKLMNLPDLYPECCLASQVIEARFLRYQDIHTGDVMQGKVLSLKPIGMQVKVTDGIKGLVPSMHLADVILKQPEKKYNIGDEVRCRVLECNPAEKKLFLTLKKTLVQSKLPVLSSYEDAEPGLITHGFVVCAREFGCIVKFYNDVKGLVPKNELSSEPISCPDKVFHDGQVVKVMVLKCEPQQERLLLSFRLSSRTAEGRSECTPKKKQQVKYQIGEMVDVKVLKKNENGLEVSILEDGDDVIAWLPTVHLSDFVVNSKLLWHCLQEGDVLPRVMCLSDRGDRIILCRKSAVISAVQDEQVVRSFSEIQPGMLLTGYVRRVMPFGVFVEFPFGVTGLAPKVSMSDKFVTDTKDHFVVGQTVIAKVMSIDEEKQRVLLNLKVSECSSGDSAAESFSLLNQYFKEMEEIKNLLKKREKSGLAQCLCELVPGKELQLVVQDVTEDGSALFSGSCVRDWTVTATRYHSGGKKVVPGEKAKGLVLHVDAITSKVYVSLREELLKKRAKQLTKNSQHPAIVQHVAEEFAIVSLLDSGRLAAVPIASHFNDTFRFDSEKMKVGQRIYATLKTVKANDLGVVLAVQDPTKKNVFVRDRKESETALEETLAAAVKHSLSLGDIVTGTVKSVKPTHVTVAIDDKLMGSIHASQILDEVPIYSFPTYTLKAGQKVTARVIGGRDVNTHRYLPITHPHFTRSVPELSIRPCEIEGKVETMSDDTREKLGSYSVGQTVTCFVRKYNILKNWLEVEVTPDIRGRVPRLLLSLNIKVLKHPEKNFKNGQALSAIVTGTDATETNLFLSLTGIQSLEPGTITVGMVAKMIPHIGLTIALPGGKTGKVSIFQLSDNYTESPLSDFKIGKVVRCYILSNENGKIQLSLRQSRLNPKSSSQVEDAEITSIKDVKKGQLLRGYVKSVTPSGVFFGLSASLLGRILFQNVSPYFVQKHSLYEKYLPEGKLLTAKVLDVNKKENHVELSLLPEDTEMPSVLPESLGLPRYGAEEEKREEDNKEKKEKVKIKRKQRRVDSESEQEAKPKKRKFSPADENDSGIEVYYREEEDGDQEEKAAEKKSKIRKCGEVPRLQVSTGFTWDEDINALEVPVLNQKEESSESEEEEENLQSKKKQTKKEKELEKQKKEKELCKLEAALMDPSRQPQSADDFDRLVLSSPNSSILWLQYMAFHLQATEIEKARAVAERALKTICFREEQEKLNVWVALLNLENMYGTEETLMKVFERAVQYNEPLKVFQHLCDIYASSEKYKQAEELYHTMLRRFRQEKSVWLKYASFLLKQGQTEATHRLLERALKALPTKEHVDVISRFAQLEFRFGDPEHAKALFESTLNSYPKRTDIWSIYMDIMIKQGSQKEVRDIFERVIHLNLAPKKMKFFFKRYLDYEKKYGTTETVMAVKTAALEYVEAKSSLADT